MSDSEEELVHASGLSRPVRWVAWSVVAALAVLAAVVVSRSHHSPRHPESAPTGASRVVASPSVRASNAAGATAPPRTSAADEGDTWWEVQGTTLFEESANQQPTRFVHSITLPRAFATPASRARVTVDPVTGWVWVVLESSRPSLMLRVSARLARIVREVRWRTPVRDVAAYAGQLYLNTEQGIATLAPHRVQPHLLPGLAGVVGPMAADPVGHRVIAVDLAHRPARIWAMAPDTSPVATATLFSADHATIAIVGEAIWIVAASGAHASLLRLDPTTLQPMKSMRLPDGLSARAVLVPDGNHDLWLSGPLRSDRLVCANATTGTALHAWRYRDVNSVASGRNRALIAVGSRFHKVNLRPCRATTGRYGAASSVG